MIKLPEGVMLANALERQQIFYTLKRWSSYTAWNRLLGYYRAWAKVAEDSMREASDKGLEDQTSIDHSDYVLILKSLAHFEEGVRRLGKGDKRVFKYDANGEFVMAGRADSYWFEAFSKAATGDIELESTTPLLEEFEAALDLYTEVARECWPEIIERERLDADACTHYNRWWKEQLLKMRFPHPLPEVPDPQPYTLVRTGRNIPFSGIWEPVDAPEPKLRELLGGLFTKLEPPEGPLPIVGTMNYLHGGSDAPRARVNTPTKIIPIDVTWRLLWKDDRYQDGTIPEEEKGYVFLHPEPPEPEKPAPVYRPSGITVAESGDKAPVAGRWLVESDLFGVVQVQAGEVLPLYKGQKVRWVLAAV